MVLFTSCSRLSLLILTFEVKIDPDFDFWIQNSTWKHVLLFESDNQNMAEELKLYGAGSPFVCRVKIVLSMKGIKYENIEEDLANKSTDLLKYNPVQKKVPVFVHSGNPIAESLVIMEYIDDVWKGVPILPQDPYEKALARFWAKSIDAYLL